MEEQVENAHASSSCTELHLTAEEVEKKVRKKS